jgi:F0F1-type ATP synthase gamma subunit
MGSRVFKAMKLAAMSKLKISQRELGVERQYTCIAKYL